METPVTLPVRLSTQPSRAELEAYFRHVRQHTSMRAAPLAPEDTVVQAMTDTSPTKWHLGHTTWFFEHFCLAEMQQEYQRHHPAYAFLFNSYYDGVGTRTPRPERGLMTRPPLEHVHQYREAVDDALTQWIANCPDASWPTLQQRVVLGIHHEQQHQELLLTDAKYLLHLNPMDIVYAPASLPKTPPATPLGWHPIPEGVYSIGFDGEGFAFDNEGPQHSVYLHPSAVADRLITNAEYRQFMDEGGYANPLIWLSEGWAWTQGRTNKAPLYWFWRDGSWWEYTLHGLRELDPDAPLTHVSYYEADAFATWAGYRLPTEAEWEIVARSLALPGQPAEGLYHPLGDSSGNWQHTAWQWTASSYVPYPGYRREPTPFGEYNGKWMVNQQVLRGSSCATPLGHERLTYRNFFHPDKCWQFTGIRLAR